jgi:trimeric autotransporter adhesin
VGIFSLSFLAASHTHTLHAGAYNGFCFYPWIRVWMAEYQPCFPPHVGGKLLLTFGPAADGGATPHPGRHSVSPAPPCIAIPTEEYAQDAFSEGIFERNFEDVFLFGSTARSASSRNNHAQPKRYLQISQDDSRNLSNIATEFSRRQLCICQLRIPPGSSALLKIPSASRLENSRTTSMKFLSARWACTGRFRVKASYAVTCLAALGLIALLPSCSSKPVAVTTFAVPATVTITPAPALSLELGTNQAFTATLQNSARASITEPVTYQSTNTAVVTVAANGLACAGSWDNLASPMICTPGQVGVAQVTAIANGVSSPPTTVYVHQHVDSVAVQDLCTGSEPNPPCTLPRHACQSLLERETQLPQNTLYQARAFSRGTDITSSVGQFTWQAVNPAVATVSNTASGLSNIVNNVSLNQVEVTAKAPGVTPIFAMVGTATSNPVNFTTCAVQSIALQVMSSTGTSETIVPTVTDTVGNVISISTNVSAIPLTWSSSQSASVSVSTSGVATGSTSGGSATVIASCTPPTCNIGFLPTLPIYPENAVQMILNPSSSAAPAATVYVGSTGCGTRENCVSTVTPVTTPTTVGTPIELPTTPNSLLFNPAGTNLYLGAHSGLLGTTGLMVIATSANTVSQFVSTPGTVLAVSPDGTKVVVSDTGDTPNQVFVFDTAANASAALPISGATAAAFSPDSLKAYIIAGSTLYVYSKVDAFQTIALRAPANDVAFLAEGAFAYLAGGDPTGVMVRRTCDNGEADTVATVATPAFIRALPNATQMLTLMPPRVSVITADTTPTGCTPAVTDSITSFDLGFGSFQATQLIIANNGSQAYILSPQLNGVLVYNINAQTSSTLSLGGNAVPLQAALTPDGTLLLVGAADGTLHEVQTATGADVAQVQFPLGLCLNTAGLQLKGVTCNPDLVAVKP